MSSSRLHRVTLFKVQKEEDKKAVITAYGNLQKNATKDGKTYIQSIVVGEALPDVRSQGYTIVARLEFTNKEDNDYYDSECPGHKELKQAAGHLHQGLLTVYYYLANL